jgi:hypothetical protein
MRFKIILSIILLIISTYTLADNTLGKNVVSYISQDGSAHISLIRYGKKGR